MKRNNRLILGAVAVALLAASCGTDGGDADPAVPVTTTTTSGAAAEPVSLVRADVDRTTDTDASTGEIAAVAAGDSDFAFDLFRVAAGDGENVLLSPYSVAAALTMTYAGARGDTATEMESTLHFGVDAGRIHAVRNALDLEITAPTPAATPDDDREPFSIEVANSLWGQNGYPFLDEFLTVLAENYGAGLNLVDFATAAEQARREINSWVEDQTNGRIVDLIPQGAIDSMTRLVLVNAIWFKANWDSPFDPEATAAGPFTTAAGDTVTVPMMHGGGTMSYRNGDGYQAVRIPYAGDASMLVIMPDPGRFSDIVAGLDAGFIADFDTAASTASVTLSMPRFEFRSELGLVPALRQLGMLAPFDPAQADFTGMTEQRELYISDVIHQAFISVDEQGTEAAAATAVIMRLTSAGGEPVTVNLDHPFLFAIQNDPTGEILFLGQVTDPS
jgi:serpin B